MTDKYRSELFSRIRKLNFTNTVVIWQFFRLIMLFSTLFALGFAMGYIIEPPSETENAVCDFFCTSFKDLGLGGSIERICRFSASDFKIALLIAASGYTMLSAPVSVFCLAYMGIKSGYCFSFLARMLISSGALTGGGATFAYIAICKFCILIATVFMIIQSTDFSYRYSELYRRTSKPILSRRSASYALISASVAGFTVLINTLFLIFQLISPSALS